VYSQATFKGATKETRERAERANVVRGSARATVVAEEGTLARPTATDVKAHAIEHEAQRTQAREGAEGCIRIPGANLAALP
jgi:hypothetical protein